MTGFEECFNVMARVEIEAEGHILGGLLTRNSFKTLKLLTMPLCTTTNVLSGPELCGWLFTSQGDPWVAHLV